MTAMSFSGGIRLTVCILVIVSDVGGVLNLKPANAVAFAANDSKVIFNCSSTQVPPSWLFSKDGGSKDEATYIAFGCDVVTGFENHYRTEQPGAITTCNLIVFDITMELAGVYQCLENNAGSALLTVIETPPMITPNISTTAIQNDTVTIACSLKYNGPVSPAPTLQPYFSWTDFNGYNVSSSYDSTTDNTAISQLAIAAGRQNINSYTCHVNLQLVPPTNPNYANDTPTVNSSASSQTVEVFYPPLISTISSEGRNATTSSCEISTVTCEATAHPTANYTWIDLEEPSKIISGVSFRYAEFGRNYSCNASNIIRTNTYTDVKTHEERNEYSTTPPCKGCHNSTVNITGDKCTNGICSCFGHCSMAAVCTADAYPEPTYHWMHNGMVIRNNTNTLDNVPDGKYSCVARNVIDGLEYEARIDVVFVNCSAYCGYTNIQDTTVEMTPTAPPANETDVRGGGENNDDLMIIVGVVIVYEIANLISMGFFLAYYNIDADRNINENNRNVATHKRALNNRFPWLERMLPCLNQSHASVGKKCLWIFLFSLITISCGVLIFPILIIMVNCCGTDLNGSQENSQLNLKLDDMSATARGGNRFPPPPSSLPPAPRLPSTSAAGLQRPIPPPNKPTRPPPPPAMTHQMNREGGAVEYAFLPLARRPHLAPAQYLDDDETSHYAILRRV